MQPARLAGIDFLNALPLLAGLGPPEVVVELMRPAEAADRLAAGSVDGALLPVAELLRIPGLAVVDGLAIAACGAVDSVLVVSRGAVKAAGRLYLDPASRTSNLLAQLVLPRLGATRAEITALPAPARLEAGEARVIIGDAALGGDWRGLEILDLGSGWQQLTGLPFVFAVWALAARAQTPAVAQALRAAAARGLASIDTIALDQGPRRGIPGELARSYLRTRVRYTLGGEERQALALFARMCVDAGLVASPVPEFTWM